MNLKSKKFWLPLALIVAFAAVATVVWLASSREPAQFVTLPDGVTYRFVGVTWGTTHNDPRDQRLVVRVINHLPPRLADYVRKKFRARLHLKGLFRTGQPALCLWLNPESTNDTVASTTANPNGWPQQAYAMLAEANGTLAGFNSITPLGPTWSGFPGASFSMVPRRSRTLECHFYADSHNSSVRGTELGIIRFANPAYGRYPQWRPETLPATKLVGDAEVHLSNCIVGIFMGYDKDPLTGTKTGRWRAPTPREAAHIHFDLGIVSPRGTNESWAAQRIEMSDATGNHFPGSWIGDSGYIEATFWPDENALRLHVEFKRASGFPAADLITFSNLPVPAPNATDGTTLTNVVDGIPIKVRNFLAGSVRAEDINWGASPTYRVEVELPAAFDDQQPGYFASPPGIAVDPVDATTDTGEKLEFEGRGDGNQFRRRILSSIPAGTKTINVTISVQKTRTVDFFVKPVTPHGTNSP